MLRTTVARITALVSILALGRGAFAIGGPCDCPADIDGNGTIGFEDVLEVLSSWGPCPGCPGDLNFDGVVAFPDLLAVLSAWGPCVFDYGPPRDDAEAEQIGLELLGPGGPLRLSDELYDRVDRDLDLIRAERPELVAQPHTLAWAPNMIILRKVAGASTDEYDALNACMQVVSEDNFAFDFWLLTFPGHVNVERLSAIYEALDSVDFAEPNGLVGGQNFWTPMPMLDETWRWVIDDGWHDCIDGCDCHRIYTIDVDSEGGVTVVAIDEFGQPWCEFDG